MNTLISLHNSLFERVERADWLLPTLARFVFAATLLMYFWMSGLTKLGDGITGIFHPTAGAYAQIFPRAFEAVGYDTDAFGPYHWAVVTAGTLAEFILPAMIVLGLLTRLSAIAMIGFIIVQTLTDIYGHGALDHPKTFGAWFDRFPDAVIMDQRLFWVMVLLVLVFKGAGPISFDRALRRPKRQ
jgi:putative oxidoreductase